MAQRRNRKKQEAPPVKSEAPTPPTTNTETEDITEYISVRIKRTAYGCSIECPEKQATVLFDAKCAPKTVEAPAKANGLAIACSETTYLPTAITRLTDDTAIVHIALAARKSDKADPSGSMAAAWSDLAPQVSVYQNPLTAAVQAQFEVVKTTLKSFLVDGAVVVGDDVKRTAENNARIAKQISKALRSPDVVEALANGEAIVGRLVETKSEDGKTTTYGWSGCPDLYVPNTSKGQTAMKDRKSMTITIPSFALPAVKALYSSFVAIRDQADALGNEQ